MQTCCICGERVGLTFQFPGSPPPPFPSTCDDCRHFLENLSVRVATHTHLTYGEAARGAYAALSHTFLEELKACSSK